MTKWFLRHPQFFLDEVKRLKSNTEYRESTNSRDNLFISCGSIIVRSSKIIRYPILIAYQDSTPYSLPLVFPLKQEYNADEIKALSNKNINDISLSIKDEIQFYTQVRHQNDDGSLCILEWDNLDTGAEIYAIDVVLKRVRQWFEGITTGKFPPDNIEIELFYHFKNKELGIKFLYPERFLVADIEQGYFYCMQFSKMHKLLVYLGIMLHGQKNGIYTTIADDMSKSFLPSGITCITDLVAKQEIIDKYVEEEKMIYGCWFDIKSPPSPFNTIGGLLEYLGEDGMGRLLSVFEKNIKKLPNKIYIGLRFPNNKKELEFQIFEVLKDNNDALIMIGDSSTIVNQYKTVKIIQSEKITDKSFHERNNIRANRDVLKNIQINIFGVGALGSEVADCLSKAGVGFFYIIDKEPFKAHNAVRHLASMEHVGEPKAFAVFQILKYHNPFIDGVWTIADVTRYSITDLVEYGSISIATIGDDNVESYLNEQAIINNNIFFYSRALRGGKVGRIFRVVPGIDACFHCLQLYTEEGKMLPSIQQDNTFPTIKNECNNPIRPSSAADLKIIASITSRIILDYLHDPSATNNHWIWTTENIEGIEYNGTQPYTLNQYSIPPHPNCYYCLSDNMIAIQIAQSHVNAMYQETTDNPDFETGGILVGMVEDDTVIITNISGPGPNAIRTSTRFEKDIDFCQEFLDRQFTESEGQVIYVGEWHYHPSTSNSPSSQDLASLTNIAQQDNYETTRPIMIIMNNRAEISCTVHPAHKRFYYVTPTINKN